MASVDGAAPSGFAGLKSVRVGDVENELSRRIFPADPRVALHVHATEITDVPRAIAEHATEFGSDLVIMCTHGQIGLRKLLFGSIAQKVAASSAVPVLLIRPGQDGAAPAPGPPEPPDHPRQAGPSSSSVIVRMPPRPQHSPGNGLTTGHNAWKPAHKAIPAPRMPLTVRHPCHEAVRCLSQPCHKHSWLRQPAGAELPESAGDD